MKKTFLFLFSFLCVFASPVYAVEADFQAKILNWEGTTGNPLTSNSNVKVVSVLKFNESEINGDFFVNFEVTDEVTGQALTSISATLPMGQEQVVVGNASFGGKIKITIDEVENELKARFVLNVQPAFQPSETIIYRVRVSAGAPSLLLGTIYEGDATIRSGFLLP